MNWLKVEFYPVKWKHEFILVFEKKEKPLQIACLADEIRAWTTSKPQLWLRAIMKQARGLFIVFFLCSKKPELRKGRADVIYIVAD